MSTAQVTVTEASRGVSSRQAFWILSPAADSAAFLLTPLAILGVFAGAQSLGIVDPLIVVALALSMGHYLPGILRAYGDRELFARYRTRLILAPLFLGVMAVGFAFRDLHGVLLIANVWGMWHWMMQIYGFARIYDAKGAPAARTPALLDQVACFIWFGAAVFVVNPGLAAYMTTFYQSGGGRFPAGVMAGFTQAWLIAAVLVTAVYLIFLVRSARNGGVNPVKGLFLAGTFAYLAYTAAVVERPLMGFVMFEVWHDVQYLALVWVFNINRTRRNPEAGAIIRGLFRPRVALGMAYVGICLAFGALTHVRNLLENDTAIRIVAALVTATAMLHYYMDGFIWKIREKQTRESLGVIAESVPASPTPARLPAWSRQAALWLLFAIPAALLLVSEMEGGAGSAVAMYEGVAQAFPSSANAQYQLARELQEGGRFREARPHFERALDLAPNMVHGRIFYGLALSSLGEWPTARAQFELAVELDPRNAEAHQNLGVIVDELGDAELARRHLERAVSLNADYALAHDNLARVLEKLGDAEAARVHKQRAVNLDPSFGR